MIISNRVTMGGNGSYDKEYGGVPESKRTHCEVEGHTILGHKILIKEASATRASIPPNCNTPNQVYIIASAKDKRSITDNGEVQVQSVAFYDGHYISYSIDLKYDQNGLIKEYSVNTGEDTTHAHKWHEIRPGIWGRHPHDKSNHLAPDSRWNKELAKAIESFNSKKIKWNK